MFDNKRGVAGAIEIVVVALVVALIGFMVWRVTTTNEAIPDDSTVASRANENEESTVETRANKNISENWKRYESGLNNFSIKIADGLSGIRDTLSDSFIFREYTSLNEPAVVEDVELSGSDGFFALMIDQDLNMWNSTEKLNLTTETITTYDGVVGTKITYDDPYEPPCYGQGCNLGYRNVIYDFKEDDSGKTTRIWYSRRMLNDETQRIFEISEDDPDYSKQIDAMVYSLIIN